jgi:branched-chain amino acid transport system permease protein
MTYYILRIYREFLNEIVAIPGRLIAFVFIIFLFLFPLIMMESFIIRIFILSAIFAIYAASWDILAGFTGQVNLGHALCFGVAAYTAGLLNLRVGLPPWATIPAGAIVAVIMGLIAGIPALRLRGFYLSLVTLSFPIILSGLIFLFPDFTGGELGIYGIDTLSGSRILDYYILVLAMLCSVFVMYKFTDVQSKIIRVGVILHAIREDEITARACGIDTSKYKMLAFAISGFFAGIAGGFYAHFLRIAGPSTLELMVSFQAILWTIFGGIATIYGAVAGVYILYPLIEMISLNKVGEQIRFILFALILILVLLFMPEGLIVWIRDKIEQICPRCKIVNVTLRRYCRACRAPLHLERKK